MGETDRTGVIGTGCDSLDSAIGGGFERGQVVQIYGESGAGKTNITASTAVNAAATDRTVAVLSQEATTFDRINSLAAGRDADRDVLMTNVLGKTVSDFDEQDDRIANIESMVDGLDLIVFDGFGGTYRMARSRPEANGRKVERRLSRQVTLLKAFARKHDLAVVLTNQVYYSPDEERVKPLGGAGLTDWFDGILYVESFSGNRHSLLVEKHRTATEGGRGWFEVADDRLVSLTPGDGNVD